MKNFKKLFQAKKKETIIDRLFNTIKKTVSNDNRKFSTRVKQLEELEKTLKRSRKISAQDKKPFYDEIKKQSKNMLFNTINETASNDNRKFSARVKQLKELEKTLKSSKKLTSQDKKPLYDEIKKQSKYIEKRKETYKKIIDKRQKDIKGLVKTTTETKKGFNEYMANTKVFKNLKDLKIDTKNPEINIKSIGKHKKITINTNLKGNGIRSFNMKDRDFIAMNNEINKGTKESYEKGLKILNTAFNRSIKELEKYEQQTKGNENLRITEVLYYQQAFERSY